MTSVTEGGTKFAECKKRFDDPTSPPMALIAIEGGDFLVGTDLAHADAMILIGNISHGIKTQAIGRIFRPLATRDNTRHIPVVHIHVGRVNHRVRGRGE